MHLAKVTKDSLELFSNLLIEATERMTRNNTPMWPPSELTSDKLLEQYSLDELYIGYIDHRPFGTLVLQDSDELYWGSDGLDGTTLYIHKFTIADEFAGKGASQLLLELARQEAERRGKKRIRLECRRPRAKVRAMYERFGFRLVKEEVIFDGQHDAAFYEFVL